MCRGLPSSVDLLSKLVPRPCPRSHAPEWRLRTIATDGDWVRGRVACCERLGVSHLLVDTRFVQTFNCNHWAVRFALKQPHWETVMLPAGQTSTSPLGVQPHRLQSPAKYNPIDAANSKGAGSDRVRHYALLLPPTTVWRGQIFRRPVSSGISRALEILDVFLVFFCRGPGFKRAEISAFSGLRIFFARIQPVT